MRLGEPTSPSFPRRRESGAFRARAPGGWIVARGAASGAEPERRTFTSASSVADHLATAAGQPGDELWILPGPQPQVGVLTLVAPLQPALVSVLTTWNREGFVVLNPTRGDVLLVDLLGTDPFVVEVQARHARADRDAS